MIIYRNTRHHFSFSLLLILILPHLTAPAVIGQQDAECTVRVTLLQVNDVYQFTPVDNGKRGGLGRILTLKRQIETESPNTIFMMAGDTISPSVESITYRGAQMIDAWNLVGLDYATFGNHEFDFGPEVLVERIKESRFAWLAANVIDRQTSKPFGGALPFVIREFDGVKVGIFGLVLPETRITSRPGATVEFLDPCETAKKTVANIRAQGANTVVALTHLSMREDKEVARCAGIDVVIGGHEHSLLQSSSGGAPIFKVTSDARELGRIDLNIKKTTGAVESIDWQVIPVDATVKEDTEIFQLKRKYAKILRELAIPVGRTSVVLDARSAANRQQETNVGNFVADAFRKAVTADVALINGGSIRADATINPGRLTRRDVLGILPFKNKVVKLEVTGATLRAALEHGVARSSEDAEPGRFPQVSGLKFSFDAKRPAGSRIVDISIGGRPLNENQKYTLATTTFLAIDGGDGYSMLKEGRLLVSPALGPMDSDALQRAIRAVRSIAPRVEGRIKRLDTPSLQRPGCN